MSMEKVRSGRSHQVVDGKGVGSMDATILTFVFVLEVAVFSVHHYRQTLIG